MKRYNVEVTTTQVVCEVFTSATASEVEKIGGSRRYFSVYAESMEEAMEKAEGIARTKPLVISVEA